MIRKEQINVDTYVILVKKGRMSIDEVPQELKEEVQKLIGEGE